ncbi:hypothetical protein LZ30DRAFT_774539 [Colletotrichum cereale]|nr:hypothetical protein LZ30DRAFT_774539 [Colletotrichum cereale]
MEKKEKNISRNILLTARSSEHSIIYNLTSKSPFCIFLWLYRSPVRETPYDVPVAAHDTGSTFHTQIDFLARFCSEGQGQRVADMLGAVVNAIAAKPKRSWRDMQLVSSSDLEHIWSWNNTVP